MSDTEEFDFGDNVDVPTFEQILEMDEGEEDDSHEFSRSIVFGFLDQAVSTFDKMDAAMAKKDLRELSSLGHFLKGSSATLGFTLVKNECEKIQNYGNNRDETGVNEEPDDDKCLALIKDSMKSAREHFATVDQLMRKYYKKLDGDA